MQRLLTAEVQLPHSIDSVFDFFKNAENLQRITPPWLDFQIVTPLPVEMQQGTLIDYRLKLYGLPFKWRTRITVWDPPFRFVDEQIKGPYKKWVHTHHFESRDGGTWMLDRVEYKSRGGVLEPIIERMFVRPDLERIFRYRREQISEIFLSIAGSSAIRV